LRPVTPCSSRAITRPRNACATTRSARSSRNDEIGALVAQRGLVHFALDGSRSRRGSSWLPARYAASAGPDLLRELAPDLDDRDVYVCGPAGWMQSVSGRKTLRMISSQEKTCSGLSERSSSRADSVAVNGMRPPDGEYTVLESGTKTHTPSRRRRPSTGRLRRSRSRRTVRAWRCR